MAERLRNVLGKGAAGNACSGGARPACGERERDTRGRTRHAQGPWPAWANHHHHHHHGTAFVRPWQAASVSSQGWRRWWSWAAASRASRPPLRRTAMARQCTCSRRPTCTHPPPRLAWRHGRHAGWCSPPGATLSAGWCRRRLAGNSAKATSGMNGAPTEYQERAGIADTLAAFHADTTRWASLPPRGGVLPPAPGLTSAGALASLCPPRTRHAAPAAACRIPHSWRR